MPKVICQRSTFGLCKNTECEHVKAHEVEDGSPCLKSWRCKACFPATWTYCIPIEPSYLAGKDEA